MLAYGLTGNIGCGKSTVSEMLSHYDNVLIINCDEIAKEIIASGEHRYKICSILGEDVFPGGKANFKKIAEIIFQKPEKKKAFERLIHPMVWTKVESVVYTNPRRICIVESAIIYETESEKRFIGVILATCEPGEQFRRLREDRGMTTEEILARTSQQRSSHEKEAKSQFVINTNCTIGELIRRVGRLYEMLNRSHK